MKKQINFKTLLDNREINAPNKFVNWCFHQWCAIVCRRNNVVHTYDYDRQAIKNQQVIFLSTHSSRNEFFYTLYGFYRPDLHIICGMQNFFKNRNNYNALNAMGVIPKLLFQPDLKGARRMLKVLKQGRSIALFPEGIQSLSGSNHPINPATIKFLKKAGLPIILATTQGAYLTGSRYSKDEKRGKIFVKYKLLFSAEQIQSMTEEQIYQLLLQNFRYNDFEANKVNRIAYKGKKPNSDGLDNILYVCPKCHKKHTLKIDGDAILCSECGYRVIVDEYYDLHEDNSYLPYNSIDEWFKWQRRLVFKEVRQDGYCMTATGKLLVLRTDCWKKAPKNRQVVFEGQVKLDCTGLTITNNLGQSRFFDIKSLYSLTLVTGKHLEFYYENDYFELYLDIPRTKLVEWTLASEELHNAVDERWYLVSNDAYDYN